MNILAIDIGGTKLAAALIDANSQISQRLEIATPASPSPQALKEALAQLVAPYQGKAQCAAVASTGIIDQGILTALNPDNLGGLNQFPLQQTLQRLTALPCTVLNDAQAAAWAEYHYLADRFKHITFITVSTGVGGGVIINGQLLTGPHAFAGHIGHTQAAPNGPRCGCGRIGCVESIASGRAIAAAAQNELQGEDARQIFSAAQNGNHQAQQLITHSAQAICQLIANLKAILDTECVVLGGSVGLAQGYRQQVESCLALLPPPFHVPVFSAHYKHDAGLIGAALFAAEQNQNKH